LAILDTNFPLSVEEFANIRTVYRNGELYYSVVDFIGIFFNLDYQRARNYYNVLKNKWRRNGVNIAAIIQEKGLSADGKYYFTDFATLPTIGIIKKHLNSNIENRKRRIHYREDDEVIYFHPQIISLLERDGWQTIHHFTLPSGSIIDVIASKNEQTRIIECKPKLSRQNLYEAIGQVLCYKSEANLAGSQATIATYTDQLTEYVHSCCGALGIELLEVPID
jgi:hypothetical protein